MRIVSKYILLFSLLAVALSAASAPVGKINARGAKIAWETDMPIFDPNTAIPDSIAQNNSAVIIARYWKLDASHENIPSIVKAQRTGLGTSDLTKAREIDRRMVKLLDKSAVENFSDFEFGEKTEDWDGNLLLTKIEEGFGLRVYKPDGTMNEIDLSTALPITDGKKGEKKKSYRIAVPGLEVGDVIDYFYYTEETRDEFDISRRRTRYAGRYPMLNFIVECDIDPTLTLEMRAYNGAPLPEPHVVDNRNTFKLHTVNLAAMPQTKYINEIRQVPFLEMRVLNNNSKLRYKPKTARPGGIYVLAPQSYYDDIAQFVRLNKYESGIPSQVASMVKKQIKAHPEWNEKKIADYAYVALLYKAYIDKDSHSPTTMAFMLRDAADKIKFTAPSGIGFINSNHDVPTMLITSWQAPDYITMIGAKPYNPALATYCAPGEWPISFQTEEGGCFRKLPEEGSVYPEMFTIPATTPNNNTRMDEMTLNIDSESENVTLDVNISAVGAHKQYLARLFNNKHIWAQLAEDYLGIEPDDRFNNSTFDSLAYNKNIYELMKLEIKRTTGATPVSVDTLVITSRGVMPDAKSFACSYKATFEDITVDAGDEMIINIGKLFSNTQRLTGPDRDRDFDAQVSFPNNYIRKLRIPLPTGYTVSPEALAALNKSINNSVGTFITNATLDNGSVLLDVTEQIRGYFVPAEKWQEFLDLTDTASDFASAALVINK